MTNPSIPRNAPEVPSIGRDNGWHESADAWIAFVESGDPNRELLLDPVMLAELGPVTGQRILDVGCGEGRFSRMLTARGANLTGLDVTVPLVQAAHKRGGGAFTVASGEALPFQNELFDRVIAYLVLIDIPDYRKSIAEIARVLRPGGFIHVANLNPFVTTAGNPWVRDQNGRRLHIKVEDYLVEKSEVVGWRDIEIRNWHRPLTDYMQAFLAHGLILRSYHEPKPTPEAIDIEPKLADGLRIPFFHVMTWEKPK